MKAFDEDYQIYKIEHAPKSIIDAFTELNGFRLGHYQITDLFSKKQFNTELQLLNERFKIFKPDISGSTTGRNYGILKTPKGHRKSQTIICEREESTGRKQVRFAPDT